LRSQYDANTILLHWFTAIVVVFQFLSGEFWDFFPRAQKNFLIVSHSSLGALLAAILLIRIAWRLSFGIKIVETSPTLLDRVAYAVHILLYVLLIAQMPLGFFTRWTGNQPIDVFGLLIPSPIGPCSKATGHLVYRIHDYDAWAIMAVAGIHAIAALAHHFLWRDEVLQRMIPGLRKLSF